MEKLLQKVEKIGKQLLDPPFQISKEKDPYLTLYTKKLCMSIPPQL
jgi:hypothetical protein